MTTLAPTRLFRLIAALLVFALLLLEIAADIYVPKAYYLAIAFAWVAATLHGRHFFLSFLGVALLFVNWHIPWSSRKSFIRQLNKIEIGMSAGEVRKIMDGYLVGSGMPKLPTDLAGSRALEEVASGNSFSIVNPSDSSFLELENALIFRHATTPNYNGDWGIIRFSNNHVTAVNFSYD